MRVRAGLNDDPDTVQHLIGANRPRSPVGEVPVLQGTGPIGVSGHLGDDFQESGGLARRLHQWQFESTSCDENDLGFTRRLVQAGTSGDGLLEW
jgi:hypothetical protein